MPFMMSRVLVKRSGYLLSERISQWDIIVQPELEHLIPERTRTLTIENGTEKNLEICGQSSPNPMAETGLKSSNEWQLFRSLTMHFQKVGDATHFCVFLSFSGFCQVDFIDAFPVNLVLSALRPSSPGLI
jgi:hypothetical protein